MRTIQSRKLYLTYSCHGRELGATIVEASVSLFLFLVLTIGIFDFGLILTQYTVLEDAMRETGRFASLNLACPLQNDQIVGVFMQEAHTLGFPLTINSVESSVSVDGSWLNLEVSADIECSVCHLLMGDGSPFNFLSFSSFPVEATC